MNNVDMYRLILVDERALLEPTFLSGNQKQRERNVVVLLVVSSKIIVEGRHRGDLTAWLSYFLSSLYVPHYFRQIIYSRSLVFYSRRYGRSQGISPICQKKKKIKKLSPFHFCPLQSPWRHTSQFVITKVFFFFNRFATMMLMNAHSIGAYTLRSDYLGAWRQSRRGPRSLLWARWGWFRPSTVCERIQRF